MSSLEDTVGLVVEEFVLKGGLFTALDVSNKVKIALPNARHHEVRSVVRDLFALKLITQGYARTPINVVVEDGSTQTAMLYHPLSDSWDLDNKYDQQKRSQTSARPLAAAQAAVQAAQNPPAHWGGALPPVAPTATPAPVAATATITASVVVPMPTARQQWNQMFQTQPSLFPKK